MLATVFTRTVHDRWKGMTIGAVSIAGALLYGMSVYRSIDLALYTDLPEALRALTGIGDGADVGSLAYGAIYGFFGALTLAALALSMGSTSIAGEERSGTIGLLLGNPKSRTQLLGSKAASMVTLTGLGALLLWGGGHLAPAILDVEVAGMHVGALVFHMFVSALFYGFLAMAIGAWTGNSTMASGATAAIMVLSYVAVGLLPLIEGLDNVAKAFPWYYFDGSQPVVNGFNWGHISVLLAASVVFAVAAVVGINRRDLKGQTVGATMVDRLRNNPQTQRIADRLAGSTRVSRISIKTTSEHQGLLFVTAALMFSVMGAMMGPLYSLINEDIRTAIADFPDTLLAIVGNGNMSTPEGWFQLETFSLMAPIAIIVVTVTMGADALAGEEQRHTMGLLLTNPIKRSRIVIEKATAMIAYAVAVGTATFAGTAVGSLLGGLGMDMGNIAATSALVTLLGLVFGGLALALSAATGRIKVAVYGTTGAALALHLLNSFLPLNESLAGYARWSPFNYYLTSDPLTNGMHWGHAALLAGLTLALVTLSVLLFQYRDLRQTG